MSADYYLVFTALNIFSVVLSFWFGSCLRDLSQNRSLGFADKFVLVSYPAFAALLLFSMFYFVR